MHFLISMYSKMYSFLHTTHYNIFMVLWILSWVLSWLMIVSWKFTCIPSRNVTNNICNTFTPQVKGIHKDTKAMYPWFIFHTKGTSKCRPRVQKNNSSRIHLNVHWCTFECIPEKLFLWTLWSVFWSEAWILSWRLYILILWSSLKHLIKFHCV